jgi:hypothetical protein
MPHTTLFSGVLRDDMLVTVAVLMGATCIIYLALQGSDPGYISKGKLGRDGHQRIQSCKGLYERLSTSRGGRDL